MNPANVSISRKGKYVERLHAVEQRVLYYLLETKHFWKCTPHSAANASDPGSGPRAGRPGVADLVSAAPRRGAAELGPDQRGAGAQRLQLAAGDVAGERHHAAVGAREEPLRRDVPQRRADRRRDVLGGLDPVGGDVDRADQDVLAGRAARSARSARASWRTRAKPGRSRCGQQRERLLVLAPLACPSVFFQSMLALMP